MYLMPSGSSAVNNRKFNLGRFGMPPVRLRGFRGLRAFGQDDGDFSSAYQSPTVPTPVDTTLPSAPNIGPSDFPSSGAIPVAPESPAIPWSTVPSSAFNVGPMPQPGSTVAKVDAIMTAAAKQGTPISASNAQMQVAASNLLSSSSNTLLLVAGGVLLVALLSGKKKRR